MQEKEVTYNYGCSYCNVKATTAVNLYEHILGHRHRKRLRRLCPDMVPLIQSLQNFLDVYMRDDPLLGLEYVLEILGENYKCFCRLCKLKFITRESLIAHLCKPSHLKKYLDKHHPAELGADYCHLSEGDKIHTINAIALKIQTEYGRQKIKSKVYSHMKDYTILGLEYVVGVGEDKYTCQLCHSEQTKQTLRDHIISPSHLNNSLDKHHPEAMGSSLKNLSPGERVKAIKEAALKFQAQHPTESIFYANIDDSVLGMESVMEVQKDKYTCPLLRVDCTTQHLHDHLCNQSHLNNDLDTHHPKSSLDSNDQNLFTEGRLETASEVALKIHNQHGSKQAKTIVHSNGPTPAKVAKYTDSEESMDSQSSGDPASSRHCVQMVDPLDQIEGLRKEISEKVKFQEFKNNVELMNYLRTFEIHSHPDAKFLRKVTVNCTRELLKFQKQQKRLELKQSTLATNLQVSAHTGWTVQECDSAVLQTVIKIDSLLSRCEADFLEGTAPEAITSG